MEGMDLNHDGRVTWDEFVAAAIDKVALLKEKNIDAVFNLLDKNSDGTITMEEISVEFGGEHRECDLELWQEILKEVDKDKCGSISREEFREAMKDVMKVKLERLHDHAKVTKLISDER
jgi:Ca2+-binding EF-hand superfamily protein